MAQTFVGATVLSIDDIKNQLRKANKELSVNRTSISYIPVKERAVKVSEQALGNHFTLDHPENGVLDSNVLELDTGLGALSVNSVSWSDNTFKEFLYVDDFIDSSNTTASVGADSVLFDDGEVLQSEQLTVGGNNITAATINSVGNLTGTGSLSYELSASEAGSDESLWLKFDETSGITASDTVGTNDGTFQVVSSDVKGYWPFDDGSVNDETANANDGTLSTATVIDNFGASTGFSEGNASSLISTNSTTYLYGSDASNIYSDGATAGDLVFSKGLSVTDFTGLVLTFNMYVKDQAALDKLKSGIWGIFYLVDTTNDFFRYTQQKDDLQIGWNVIRIDCDNANSESGTPDLTQIDEIRILIENSSSPREIEEGEIIFDYLQHGSPVKAKDHLSNENGALYFPGGRYYDTTIPGYVGDTVNVYTSTSPQQLTSANSFTLGLWFKADSDTTVVSSNNVGLFGYGYNVAVHIDSNGHLEGGVRDGSTSETNDYNTSVFDDTWHRFIMTYDASNSTLTNYIDGNEIGSRTVTVPFDTGTDGVQWASRTLNNNIQTFQGAIGETFINHDYAWESQEVSNDYNAQLEAKWNSPITAGKTGNAVRINGITQYELASTFDLDNDGSSIAWWMYVSQDMIDYGNTLFGNTWNLGSEHIVMKMSRSDTQFIYVETDTNGAGFRFAQPDGFSPGWHHFALVLGENNKDVKLYVDNVAYTPNEYFGTPSEQLHLTFNNTDVDAVGGTVSAAVNQGSYVNGKLGNAIHLDNNDELSYTASNFIDSYTRGGVAFWVRPDEDWNDIGTGDYKVLFKAEGTGAHDDLEFYLDPSASNGRLNFSNVDNATLTFTGALDWEAGRWYHMVVTWSFNSGDYRIYRDGALIHSDTGAATAPGVGTKFYIGSYDGTNYVADAAFDDFRYFKCNNDNVDYAVFDEDGTVGYLYNGGDGTEAGGELHVADDLTGIQLIGNQGYGYNYGDLISWKIDDLRVSESRAFSSTDIDWLYNGGDGQSLGINIKWESVTPGEQHTFAYSGNNLRYRITSTGDKTLSVLNNNNTYKPIRISYKEE